MGQNYVYQNATEMGDVARFLCLRMTGAGNQLWPGPSFMLSAVVLKHLNVDIFVCMGTYTSIQGHLIDVCQDSKTHC